ncbi:MucB/RseB C-terminal domain-containing protein [Alicycliphilus sp. T452]|jgi:sigma-E factor negative regulatory protein RseB
MLMAAAPAARAHEANTAAPGEARESMDVAAWIGRMRQAALGRNYSGTFVVLSAHGAMASSRIWHACDGQSQIERVESLSGTPRVVFRRDGEVRTFLPRERIVRSEMQGASASFPRVPDAAGVQPARHYMVQMGRPERVAGLDADMLAFVPRDAWRFGYRVWIDRASGLLVKMQTLDGDGRVLEQAAFSELTMGVPLGLQSMARMMADVAGYRLVAVSTQPTTAQAEGWTLDETVAGFASQGCYRRQGLAPAEPARPVVQCIYSDGMATLSVFMEPYVARRHPLAVQEASMGATQVLAQRMSGDTWVTAVGEVPPRTLRYFMQTMRRGR